ncbi:unnamed protein product [Gongylonema pulchrum]|uniref:CRAL-TRIO domain-containing protein n=1 Tax=Gongylonema pulchrum TaxID=637853 RepID=A0A183EV35_9BILA|nr:unnamed protein product [Gongylonema pulchrum]
MEEDVSTEVGIEADSDVEEVLLEPRFKYSRILNSVPAILRQDAATCMAIHDKFAALGSRSGYVYIVDHFGNLHPENVRLFFICFINLVLFGRCVKHFVQHLE